MASKQEHSYADPSGAKDLELAIAKLEGSDRVGTLGQTGTVAAGAAAGGAVAAVVGTAAIPGLTSMASAVGLSLVVSTPVGWVVGCAIAGAAGAYGISKLVKSGGRNDRLREEIRARLSSRLSSIKFQVGKEQLIDQLTLNISKAVDSGLMHEEQASRMINLVESGKMDAQLALDRISAMLEDQGQPIMSSNISEEEIASSTINQAESGNNLPEVASQGAKRVAETMANAMNQATHFAEKVVESNSDTIQKIKGVAGIVSDKASESSDIAKNALSSSVKGIRDFLRGANNK